MIPSKRQHRKPYLHRRPGSRDTRGITRTTITKTEHADPLELLLDDDDGRAEVRPTENVDRNNE